MTNDFSMIADDEIGTLCRVSTEENFDENSIDNSDTLDNLCE